MTGDKTKFAKLELKEEEFVTYRDNNKGRIHGNGVIGNGSFFNIKNVLLVEGLKHNLISISQLCDKGFKVMFESNNSFIYDAYDSIVLIGKIVNNIYLLDLHHASFSIHCLLTKEDDTWLWHRRLCHIHMQHFNRLNRKQLVEGLPKLKFKKDGVCEACQKGKQTKVSFKPKNVVSTERPLVMLHMDLFGPSRTMSLGGNLYAFVIVDDFSRYTWTLFLAAKNDTFHAFKRLAKMLEKEKSSKIVFILSDHGGEFQNERFEQFCENMALSIIFLYQEPHNKMVLLKGKHVT